MLIILILFLTVALSVSLKVYFILSKKSNKDLYTEKKGRGKIKSFGIYYNKLRDETINKLSKADVAIIEPRIVEVKEIDRIKAAATKVYGYISFVEQNKNNSSFKDLSEECFYRPEGSKVSHDKWDSYFMDIRNPRYREFLMSEIQREIVDKKLDGIFIDTIGDIDDSSWDPNHKNSMRKSYIEFLKIIKGKFPSLAIIQNWGIYTAHNYSSKFIDGLMWENFSYDLLKNDKWSADRYREIEDMQIDFYIVTRKKEMVKPLKNKVTYVFIHDSEIYSSI